MDLGSAKNLAIWTRTENRQVNCYASLKLENLKICDPNPKIISKCPVTCRSKIHVDGSIDAPLWV